MCRLDAEAMGEDRRLHRERGGGSDGSGPGLVQVGGPLGPAAQASRQPSARQRSAEDGRNFGEPLRDHAEEPPGASPSPGDRACFGEDLEVVAHSVLGQPERVGEVADTGLAGIAGLIRARSWSRAGSATALRSWARSRAVSRSSGALRPEGQHAGPADVSARRKRKVVAMTPSPGHGRSSPDRQRVLHLAWAMWLSR
jgi:hypothetical protein